MRTHVGLDSNANHKTRKKKKKNMTIAKQESNKILLQE
jgi:hypothetical protein